MVIFDSIILDTILICMPLAVYLLYIAYSKAIDKRENNLLLVFTIFTILYLLLKYSKYQSTTFLIINIPLLISYLKKNKPSILITSLIMVAYYYGYYHNFLIIFIIEYLIYYLIYLQYLDKLQMNKFVLIFVTIKTMISIIIMPKEAIIIIIQAIILYILANFIIYLFQKTEDMLKIHKTIQEIEQDKQIKTSLFRITHEIKNPIAVCKGYLDMFDSNNPEHFKKYIPILKEEIDRTLLLLEDFLAMNKIKINKDIIDINMLMEEVISNIDMLCQKNNIQLISNINDEEVYVNADYNRLMQVFINIIKNSIEALKEQKNGKIEINEKINDREIIIKIKDNGSGMSKEILNKIKEPFYTTKPKGTGLGVSLSEEIIKAHKGSLTYKSKEKNYTEVTIILPLEKAI